MIVAIAILGTAFALAKLGVDWMVALGRQKILLEAQWNAQVTLYEITREVRNCKQIVDISSSSLTLSVFRPREIPDGFAHPELVVAAATGTVVYDYVSNGTESYLRRSYTYPDPNVPGATATRQTKLLVNMLEPPVNDMWMFQPYGSTVPGSYEAVEIRIRLRHPSSTSGPTYWSPIEYRTISMKRTATYPA